MLAGDVLQINEFGCDEVSEEQVWQNLALLRDAVQQLDVDVGFVGIDGIQVKRRSCALINEFDHPQIDESYIRDQLQICDGDLESLSRGLQLLERCPELRDAIDQNNLVMNRVIGAVMSVLQHSLGI
ncbi:MAG: hypothetical protein JJ992_13575, partial [Planctomycetes bacterium]|nr:hypothetical protein [Planctomycetota bacterium]